VPIQIGAADVAFPRLNAMSYWLYLFGSLMVLRADIRMSGSNVQRLWRVGTPTRGLATGEVPAVDDG
jgi:heme/copper-type cytochrome/quinol oxidase subunit 1